MKALGEVLALSIKYLKERGCERPRLYAESIIAHVLQKNRLDLYLNFDCPLEEFELEKVRGSLKRVVAHEPLEYVLGSVDFFGCEIKVSPHVLIPRPETELLVEAAVKVISQEKIEGKVAWDVCTGSGCIGLALKKAFPYLEVSLSDISSQALAIARGNASRNKLSVFFREGDLLQPFEGNKANFIFCNPPYVSIKEYSSLTRSVRDYEPVLALVGGETGLEFYEKLAKALPEHLFRGGKVFFEIGYNQENDVISLFSDPCWVKKEVIRDLAGHPRFFFLEIE